VSTHLEHAEAWVDLRAVTSELAETDIETRRLFSVEHDRFGLISVPIMQIT
jgi:hypothetical protein